MESLKGRVAIITGGATGIGFATARALVTSGASVVLAGRNRERGEAAVHALGSGRARGQFIEADVRADATVERLFRQVAHQYRRLDFLFNNAGIEGAEQGGLVPGDASLSDLLDTNIKGVFLCLKHALPRLVATGGGVVVNAGSFVGTTAPVAHAAAYGATKSAVLSLTRSMAPSYERRQVAMYAVCPWITDTPMVDRLTGHDQRVKTQFARMNPSGHIAYPDEVARVVVSMFAGTAGVENGAAVLVDHGGTVQIVEPMRPGRILTSATGGGHQDVHDGLTTAR